MKKKILSLILVLMLIPFASLFSACGKDKAQDMTKLNDNFYNIANVNNNIKLQNGKMIIDFSSHSNLDNFIQTNQPYDELVDYNYVFDNLMSFSFSHIDVCSVKSKSITKEIKKDVEADLADFTKTINDVNENINIFAESVLTIKDETVCLTRFNNLLDAYEDMFQSAINFNSSLSDLYFDHILNDSNPDVFSVGVENFDANMVVNKLESRIKYQLSCLSQSFVEMYVDGSLADRVTNGEDFDLDRYDYKSNVNSIAINQDFDEKVAAEKANHENNKERFYELSVQAQNIQATLKNDKNKFVTASNEIEYSAVVGNVSATPYEKMCANIIEGNYDLTCNYNDVLAEMIKIITDTGV